MEVSPAIPADEIFELVTKCTLCFSETATKRSRYDGLGITTKDLLCEKCDAALFATFNVPGLDDTGRIAITMEWPEQ